jgi:hypothetical protein
MNNSPLFADLFRRAGEFARACLAIIGFQLRKGQVRCRSLIKSLGPAHRTPESHVRIGLHAIRIRTFRKNSLRKSLLQRIAFLPCRAQTQQKPRFRDETHFVNSNA